MKKTESISSTQLILIVVGSLIMFSYTFFPIFNTSAKNQDAWIAVILSAAYYFIFSIPILFLVNKFKHMKLNDALELILGKYVGKAFSLIFVSFFLLCYTLCMLVAIVFINSFLLPNTPSWVLLLFLIYPSAYAAFKGIGSIARLAFFVVPYIILTIILFMLLGIEKMELINIKPVLADSSFLQLNISAILSALRHSEILIFLILSTYLEKGSKINKAFSLSIFIYMILELLMAIPIILVLGHQLAGHSWNPYYIYTRQVRVYEFVQNLESFNALAWFLGSLLKLSVYNYLASHVLSNVFNAKSHKKFIFFVSVLTFSILLIPAVDRQGFVDLIRSDNVFPPIVSIYILVVPIIIIIVYLIRRQTINPILKDINRGIKKECQQTNANNQPDVQSQNDNINQSQQPQPAE